MTIWRFVLQLPPSQISQLAERYGYAQDDRALRAGMAIRHGDYSRENLKEIVAWKSQRRLALIDENSSAAIYECLRFACTTRSERTAIETLLQLRGVGIPVASAILTTIYPDRFTIIDFRALEALGVAQMPNLSVEYFLAYLEACRAIGRAHGTTLRTLDRALWQWSKERGRKESCNAGVLIGASKPTE